MIQLTDLSRKMENLVEQILPFQSIEADLREGGSTVGGVSGHDDITTASRTVEGTSTSITYKVDSNQSFDDYIQ